MGAYIQNDPAIVFSALCKERSGEIIRCARPFTRTLDDAIFIYNRLKGLPSMFCAVPMVSLQPIFNAMDAGWQVLMVDDVGLVAYGVTMVETYVDVHITFWDRILRGRESLARRAITWAIDSSGAEGVYTAIPASSKATIAFAKRVGFETAAWINKGARDKTGEVDDCVVLEYVGDIDD